MVITWSGNFTGKTHKYLFFSVQEIDDLALGAEARHYGNCSIISPRLSPASSFERLNDGRFAS